VDLDVNLAPSSPTWPTTLDIVGDLLTNRCKSRSSCSIDGSSAVFGKLPKLCRFACRAWLPPAVVLSHWRDGVVTSSP